MKSISSLAASTILLAIIPAAPAAASQTLDFPGLRLDLFGGAAWGRTSSGVYLDATDSGEFENGVLAINGRHEFSSSLAGIAQVELIRRPGDSDVDLDYLFLDWRPNDATTWRFGRTKQPFGLYAEFHDLGTDRPFYDLPQSVYGPTEIVAESLDGVSFLLRRDLGASELHFEAYLGRVRFEASEPWEGLEDHPPAAGGDTEEVRRDETVGIRVEWEHQSGLTLGFSAFRGEDEHGGDEDFSAALGAGLHLRWENDLWLLRAEAVRFDEGDNLQIDAAYLEAAHRFGQHWQSALRWDRSTTRVEETDLGTLGTAALGHHRDLAAGLNYWINSNLVLKLSHHWVEGEHFLRGEDGGRQTDGAEMWRFGVQFLY